MKPWDDYVCEMDDDEIEALWRTVLPEDFYFAFKGNSVVITPASYFDAEGYCYDQHLDIGHLLPRELHLEAEGQWSTIPGPIGQTETQLLIRGFVQNQKFTDFIAETADE